MNSLPSRISQFEQQHDLKRLIEQIPWDLREGPSHRLEDPRGIPLSEGKLARLDLSRPFAEICYIFRHEFQPEQMTSFIKNFDHKPNLYKKFMKITKYLYLIELYAPLLKESDSPIRALLYFISLNGLFDNKYELSQQYQNLFKNYLSQEDQDRLVQYIDIEEVMEDQRTKLLDLDISTLVNEFYKVFRCGGAHGEHLLSWTHGEEIIEETPHSSGVIISYEDDGKVKRMWNNLPRLYWELLVRKIILSFFEEKMKNRA